MREGYIVLHDIIQEDSNCIIVSNLDELNYVCNCPCPFENLHLFRHFNDIGVWKIKQLKN